MQFLLTSAAADFRAHRPPDPARFRGVRFGHLVTSDGTKRYMLCGELLPAGQEGKEEWMQFTTIKTSGYEQWLGRTAGGFCEDPSVVWDSGEDFSSALQSQLDSLR